MKEENIVRYTRDHLPEDTESDMVRVESMTEADIEEAARTDPDAQPTDDKFLSRSLVQDKTNPRRALRTRRYEGE